MARIAFVRWSVREIVLHSFSKRMVPAKTTRRQRLIASGWLLQIWLLTVPTGFTVLTVASIGPLRYVVSDIWLAGQTALACVLSFGLGYCVAIPTAWVLFGPIWMEQGERNGSPFKPGDVVQVISGPYQNRISQVYSTWQHEAVRVELGADAKAGYRDIFSAFQLLRVEADDGTNASPAA